MGTLFSGVGLSTGLDITSLVDQLIAASSGPRDQLVGRIGTIDAQKTGLLDVSARISAMLANLTSLNQSSTFRSSAVNTSAEGIISVSTSDRAQPGSYDFTVRQLATRHQQVSRGFSSRDDRLDVGTIRLESAQARTNSGTDLDTLNGFRGVQRGSFSLEDAAGNTAQVSIADAVTVDDVIERINAAGLDIQAELRGDQIALRETTGGVLTIREVDGGNVAADLGFAAGNTISDQGGASDELLGGTLMALSSATPLSALNEGAGVRVGRGGGDFTVNGISFDLSSVVKPETRLAQLNGGNGVELGTIQISTFTENGSEIPTEVDLTGLVTVGDVKAAIESAVPDVSVTLTSSKLIVKYREDPDAPADDDAEPLRLKITDLSGRSARDLGISGDSEGGQISGNEVLSSQTVGDVLAAINYGAENDGSISARIEGTRLVLDGGGAALGIEAVGDTQSLFDLGFETGGFREAVSSGRLIGGVNTTLVSALNGGKGYELGTLAITVGEDASAQTIEVDVSGAETLQEIVDAINTTASDAGLSITAGYDRTGTRLTLQSDDRVTPISVDDVKDAGKLAQQLGLVGQTGPELLSNDLERQYVSETTQLATLNGGAGIGLGEIKITNSNGLFATLDLSSAETVGDVIQRINQQVLSNGEPFGVTARINDSGDGIVVEDANGGTLGLKIEDVTGTAAADLRIAGTGELGSLDGSYEINIDVSGSDTLDDLVARINEEGLAEATILNDGSAVNPFRLQISSAQTGRAGELLIEDGGLGLNLTTLSRPQDAVVVVGGEAGGLVVTSNTNTLTDIAPGITLDLTSTSEDPVSVTITRDDDLIVEQVDGFVSAFNAAIERIDELTDFNAETETAGVLLGDSTLASIERRLFGQVIGNVDGSPGGIRRLAELGIRVEGGSLSFDAQALRDRLAEDPDSVVEFFTDKDDGFAVVMDAEIDRIVESDGLLGQRDQSLENQKTELNDRVERLNELLDRRRDRLTRQFLAMEQAVAELQSQQNALSQLGSLAAAAGP